MREKSCAILGGVYLTFREERTAHNRGAGKRANARRWAVRGVSRTEKRLLTNHDTRHSCFHFFHVILGWFLASPVPSSQITFLKSSIWHLSILYLEKLGSRCQIAYAQKADNCRYTGDSDGWSGAGYGTGIDKDVSDASLLQYWQISLMVMTKTAKLVSRIVRYMGRWDIIQQVWYHDGRLLAPMMIGKLGRWRWGGAAATKTRGSGICNLIIDPCW